MTRPGAARARRWTHPELLGAPQHPRGCSCITQAQGKPRMAPPSGLKATATSRHTPAAKGQGWLGRPAGRRTVNTHKRHGHIPSVRNNVQAYAWISPMHPRPHHFPITTAATRVPETSTRGDVPSNTSPLSIPARVLHSQITRPQPRNFASSPRSVHSLQPAPTDHIPMTHMANPQRRTSHTRRLHRR